jgi:hypothetical protein
MGLPKLARIRFVSVGHPNARFTDMILDFRDAGEDAVDSTIWLRNGGGKSSILNLFFGMVRPDRREFLGGRAEARRRRIEDYVQKEDHSVVAAEWQLDTPADQLSFNGLAERYVTGTFYEWRTSSGGPSLRRLFFAGRVPEELSAIRLEDLPLFTQTDGVRRRRTMASFRQEWMDLRNRYPHLGLVATENQGEWQEVLDAAGIDPELYAYQVRMNQREGGVDELFRFDSHEQFVDFLLELVIDPALGARVSRNIGAYRRELKERKDRLIPERELAEGLSLRLAPLEKLAEARRLLRSRCIELAAASRGLKTYIAEHSEFLKNEIAECDEKARAAEAEASSNLAQAQAAERRAAALRRFAARRNLASAQKELERMKQEQAGAQRRLKIWDAALPLRNALRAEQKAKNLQEELERRQKAHAPDLMRLEEAAARYADALKYRVVRLREEEANELGSEKEAREEAAQCNRFQTECRERRAVAETQIKSLEEFLNEADRERERLLNEGFLLAAEDGRTALERLGKGISDLKEHRESLVLSLEAARNKVKDIGEERVKVADEAGRMRAQVEASEHQMEEALHLRAALESEPVLCRQLEVESVDLERMTEAAFLQLQEFMRRVLDQVVRLKIERAEDERAVMNIEEKGLLPAGRDTEQVIEFLREKLAAVWSGWGYAEVNAPGAEQVKEWLRQWPQLLTGVIVRDDDFQKAVEMLQDGACNPETPVAVAPQSAIHSDSSPAWVVAGPSSEGFFNRKAAREDLARRRSRLESTESEIRLQEGWREEVEEVTGRLREFRRRYPMGWFASHERQLEAKRTGLENLDHRVHNLEREMARIETEIQQNETDIKEADKHLSDLEKQQTRIGQFVNRYEDHLDTYRQGLFEAQQKLSKATEESIRWEEEGKEAEGKAATHAEAARQKGQEARAVEEELRSIAYLSQPPSPVAGPIDECRDRYQQAKSVYEGKIGEETLLQLQKRELDLASEERRKLAQKLDSSLDEAAVVDALTALSDPSDAEAKRDEATRASYSVSGAVGRQTQIEEGCQRSLEQADDRCRSLGRVPEFSAEEEPRGPIQAEEEAKALDRKVAESRNRAAILKEDASVSSSRAREARHQAESLKKDGDHLGTVLESYRKFLPSDEEILQTAAELPADEGDVADGIRNLDIGLREISEKSENLDTERKDAVREIRAWATEKRFEDLQSHIARQFALFQPEELEERAGTWQEELRLRMQTIDSQLSDMNRHRDTLISEVLAAAEEGLTVLKSAASRSLLPDHVPGLGGSQFLRILTHVPEQDAERRGRIGELVDLLVDSGEMPSGMGLVQQAVRRLARPIRARVLNPDPDLDRQSVDIPDMARFSGGEQLTGAILLYCTLAQLRVRTRGLSRKPSTVLLLDNPIGRASRVRFLELQREVARAMGVQLIYTTAVNDLEALRSLPNIIRIRNQRVDRNTGYRVIEQDNSESRLEAARIVRSEGERAEG